VCSSPRLIAAYHVLHRLSDPRHPPCALSCFKKFEIVVMLPPLFDFDTLDEIAFSNMSKNFNLLRFEDVLDLNQMICHSNHI
jgi:hypothetical protein